MSYVSEGKSVLGICEKVEKKPKSIQGMPPGDLGASKKILLKYVKNREELVQALAELIEMTKVTSLPGDSEGFRGTRVQIVEFFK